MDVLVELAFFIFYLVLCGAIEKVSTSWKYVFSLHYFCISELSDTVDRNVVCV